MVAVGVRAMTSRKVTITVDETTLRQVRAVSGGNVSAFFQDAAERQLAARSLDALDAFMGDPDVAGAIADWRSLAARSWERVAGAEG